MDREELNLWLTCYARFLHGRGQPFLLKPLERLLRFPNVHTAEHAGIETGHVQYAARWRSLVEFQRAHHLIVLILSNTGPFHRHHSWHYRPPFIADVLQSEITALRVLKTQHVVTGAQKSMSENIGRVFAGADDCPSG